MVNYTKVSLSSHLHDQLRPLPFQGFNFITTTGMLPCSVPCLWDVGLALGQKLLVSSHIHLKCNLFN